ncbi:MBL fold metallo-hydrolase [Pseudemcibacter aquimaris]|uniref:MBL fold metallo-hydrolase n=1 Tax=Pseudemcibacter aquimaris TaxID=2857064 RepID=UPI0020114322|nr:MBL fold metallo-hydrolase [Pseudemcibacter aquimaris]MCC3862502.1 MBL fold metallo-hydrolase [Pseudemcibacter aquimaris]WDU57764.1 MBL fold metallo-hydrolase [Pseudemcibacter aquimaris]
MIKKIFLSFIAFSFSLPTLAADYQVSPDNDVMKLTFLGTGAPRPSTERYGPSIYVEAGDHKILVDAGPGMRERLFEAGGFDAISGVDHVIVTHLHFDHTVSISSAWLSGWLFGRRVPLRVQGPKGIKNMMDHIEKAYQWDIDYRVMVGVPKAGTELIVDEVSDGVIFDEDGLKITAFQVEHMPIDISTGDLLGLRGETLGFRIDYKGHSVLFSGDTRSTEKSEINKVGEGVDLLIHEVQVPSPGATPEANLANVSLTVHSTPEQVGHVFARTKPKMAVYSHIIPPGTTEADLRRDTAPYYDGPLTVAHDMMEITLTGDDIIIGERERQSDGKFEDSKVLDK